MLLNIALGEVTCLLVGLYGSIPSIIVMGICIIIQRYTDITHTEVLIT